MQEPTSENISIEDSAFKSRISRVNVRCDALYDNCADEWIRNAPHVSDILAGTNIVEIGCGPNGGLAMAVREYGAKSYIGIDIDKTFIASSRKHVPNAVFIWDDPLYVLKNLNMPVTCVSSGVIDSFILRDPLYAQDLIKTISEVTPVGGYSIHQAFMIAKEYGSLFERYGFRSLNRGVHQYYNSRFGVSLDYDFEAYERVK